MFSGKYVLLVFEVGDPMNDYFLTVNYSSSFDDDLNIINCCAKLNLINMKTDEEIDIGHANFNLFNSYRFADWFELVDCADGISGDTYEVLNVLTPFIDEEEINGKIVILNSFEIKDDYRNSGWGSMAMEEFLKYWSYKDIDYIALKPAPPANIEGKEREMYIKRLTEFYGKFGMSPLKSREYEEPCMGKNLNYL